MSNPGRQQRGQMRNLGEICLEGECQAFWLWFQTYVM